VVQELWRALLKTSLSGTPQDARDRLLIAKHWALADSQPPRRKQADSDQRTFATLPPCCEATNPVPCGETTPAEIYGFAEGCDGAMSWPLWTFGANGPEIGVK
jgi:hypothetical protein